jgi:hypothetical protein
MVLLSVSWDYRHGCRCEGGRASQASAPFWIFGKKLKLERGNIPILIPKTNY